jgi:hypothetical protein
MACIVAIALVGADAGEAKGERETRSRSAAATQPSSRAAKASRNKASVKQRPRAKAKAKSKAKATTRKSSVRRRDTGRRRAVSKRRAPARRVVRGSKQSPRSAPLAVLHPSSPSPSSDVLKLALRAYACGEAEGQFEQPYLTIIDYSLPSNARRLWVIDVRSRRVLFNELVAHGRNTGEDEAVAFSNVPGSHQSSLGLYRTEDVYVGQHGGSLRLTGLEPGYNDAAFERAIVMHGARYVSTNHLAEYGRLGRSLGCPALPMGVHERIIERIQGGSAVFAYYPDRSWLHRSRYLHCDGRVAQR